MRAIVFILSLVQIFIFLNSAMAQECPVKIPSSKEVEVTVSASVGIEENNFVYNYTLYSSTKSKQDVWNFLVDNLSDILSVTSPKGWEGSRNYNRQPYFWGSDFSETNIKPKESLGGFGIKSSGLPAIVTYYAAGWHEPLVVEEEFDEELCPELDILVNSVKGKTIGPTAPPADFKSLDFLDYIISMKHEATSLGWMKDKGIEQSLDSKLDNAKKKLEQGNNTAAKNILEAFIHEVEAQKDKHMTSEAYGLLKYNVQYLIERL